LAARGGNLDLARAIPPPPRARHCTCPPARPSAILEEPPGAVYPAGRRGRARRPGRPGAMASGVQESPQPAIEWGRGDRDTSRSFFVLLWAKLNTATRPFYFLLGRLPLPPSRQPGGELMSGSLTCPRPAPRSCGTTPWSRRLNDRASRGATSEAFVVQRLLGGQQRLRLAEPGPLWPSACAVAVVGVQGRLACWMLEHAASRAVKSAESGGLRV